MDKRQISQGTLLLASLALMSGGPAVPLPTGMTAMVASSTPKTPPPIVLEWVEASASLSQKYRIPVEPLPEPPAHEAHSGDVARGPTLDCPFEVRALVDNSNGKPFAVVATAGHSQVVELGDAVSIRHRDWHVADVGPDGIRLRRGEASVRCSFGHAPRGID